LVLLTQDAQACNIGLTMARWSRRAPSRACESSVGDGDHKEQRRYERLIFEIGMTCSLWIDRMFNIQECPKTDNKYFKDSPL